MSKAGKTGVTENTPKNIWFGAGTIHKNLKRTGENWNFEESIIGATSGGSKLSIVPEVVKVEVDGALVSVKGLNVKTGEKATFEINFREITEELVKKSIFAKNSESDDSSMILIESKPHIEAGDYFDNIAFVGETLDHKKVIVILDNALCTSGFETSTQNKNADSATLIFECHAELDSDLDTLPYHIYYPKAQ